MAHPIGTASFLHFQPVLLDRLFPSFHHVISLSPDEAINGVLVDLASVRYCSYSSNPKLVGIGNGKERRTVVDRPRLTLVQHRRVFPGHCLKSKRPRPDTLQSACCFCSSIFKQHLHANHGLHGALE